MRNYLLILFGILLSSLCFSQTQYEDSIDIVYKKCIKDSTSNQGQCFCAMQAMESWENEMNNNYYKLLYSLNRIDLENLRASQKEWIDYYKKELQLVNTLYMGGYDQTIYCRLLWDKKTELVKTRAIEFKKYCELLSEY